MEVGFFHSLACSWEVQTSQQQGIELSRVSDKWYLAAHLVLNLTGHEINFNESSRVSHFLVAYKANSDYPGMGKIGSITQLWILISELIRNEKIGL